MEFLNSAQFSFYGTKSLVPHNMMFENTSDWSITKVLKFSANIDDEHIRLLILILVHHVILVTYIRMPSFHICKGGWVIICNRAWQIKSIIKLMDNHVLYSTTDCSRCFMPIPLLLNAILRKPTTFVRRTINRTHVVHAWTEYYRTFSSHIRSPVSTSACAPSEVDVGIQSKLEIWSPLLQIPPSNGNFVDANLSNVPTAYVSSYHIELWSTVWAPSALSAGYRSFQVMKRDETLERDISSCILHFTTCRDSRLKSEVASQKG